MFTFLHLDLSFRPPTVSQRRLPPTSSENRRGRPPRTGCLDEERCGKPQDHNHDAEHGQSQAEYEALWAKSKLDAMFSSINDATLEITIDTEDGPWLAINPDTPAIEVTLGKHEQLPLSERISGITIGSPSGPFGKVSMAFWTARLTVRPSIPKSSS
jgi:hypothetical protein